MSSSSLWSWTGWYPGFSVMKVYFATWRSDDFLLVRKSVRPNSSLCKMTSMTLKSCGSLSIEGKKEGRGLKVFWHILRQLLFLLSEVLGVESGVVVFELFKAYGVEW